jgi:hypothetical protein
MLYVWLIPLLVILVVLLCAFYLVLRSQGGSGVRIEGRILVDKPDDEAPTEE